MEDIINMKVKSWDELKNKYGLTSWDAIKIRYLFTKDMEDKLPDDRVIGVVKKGRIIEWNSIDKYGREVTHEMSEDLFEGE